MTAAYVIVTVVAAVVTAYAATVDFVGVDWVLANMARLGVPEAWLLPLGALKAAGALGLVVGIGVPAIGVAAAVGLVLFFVGAIATVVRARWYAHWYPAMFLLLAAGTLALRVASLLADADRAGQVQLPGGNGPTTTSSPDRSTNGSGSPSLNSSSARSPLSTRRGSAKLTTPWGSMRTTSAPTRSHTRSSASSDDHP